MKTTNHEHRTTNIEARSALRLALVSCVLFSAAMAAAEPALLTDARRALAESIPQIAIQKIEALRADPALGAEDGRAATLLLAEALLATGRKDDALRTLGPLATGEDAAARSLRAQILVAAGRWSDALPICEQLANDAGGPASAKLGLAECLAATGRTSRAIDLLDAFVRANPAATTARLRLASFLVDARKAGRARETLGAANPESGGDLLWKQYIGARLLLLENKPADAAAAFEAITQSPQHLSENLLVAATLGLTDARIATSGNEVADNVLENFIWKYPESASLELVFRRLEQVYAGEKNPPESEMQKWAAAPEKRRAALARYHVARMQMRARRLDRATNSLNAFIAAFPDHPLLPHVRIMQADVLSERRQFPGAIAALEAAERHAGTEELRAAIELRAGLVHFQQGEFLLASNQFESAARRSATVREPALFDAALATLNTKNFERFDEQYRELGALFPDADSRADLLIEDGLLQARIADPRAAGTLQLFLAHFAKHPRVAEARLALAEIDFAAGNHPAAARWLKVASQGPRSAATDEQAEYLAVFLEEANTPRDDAKVIAAARQFISRHAGSPLLAEVRLKLGQVHFRSDDYANAETQFVTLAKESPASPYAESALFLAGQSAMKSINTGAIDRALGLFDQVVKRDGPLKFYARQQQAIVQSSLGNETEAVKLCEIILAAQPPADAGLRYAAWCAKGNSLAILGRTEPAQLEAALRLYDDIAASGAPAAWRNQALFKKGAALELLKREPEALLAWYDVLGRTTPEDREYFWFYKAGFEAARIFEAAKEWKSAIGIYEKMAAPAGPRADEARMRVKQLRLEHFIWE